MASLLRCGTLNIISGGNSRLQQAIRCMRDMNMDFGILTETKLHNDFYAREADGYTINASKADSAHKGGVALFHRESDLFVMEGTKAFGPNVIRATLVAGTKRWTVIGVYIPCSETDGSTLAHLEKAKCTAPVSQELILLGDFNADLFQQHFRYGQETQFAMVNLIGQWVLTDIFGCFCQKSKNGGRIMLVPGVNFAKEIGFNQELIIC